MSIVPQDGEERRDLVQDMGVDPVLQSVGNLALEVAQDCGFDIAALSDLRPHERSVALHIAYRMHAHGTLLMGVYWDIKQQAEKLGVSREEVMYTMAARGSNKADQQLSAYVAEIGIYTKDLKKLAEARRG